jgi:excisionase family DNA binding protein
VGKTATGRCAIDGMSEDRPWHNRRPSETWLTTTEAATLLGVAPKTVYRLIATGRLAASRIDGTRTIRLARVDVDRLLKRVPAAGQ